MCRQTGQHRIQSQSYSRQVRISPMELLPRIQGQVCTRTRSSGTVLILHLLSPCPSVHHHHSHTPPSPVSVPICTPPSLTYTTISCLSAHLYTTITCVHHLLLSPCPSVHPCHSRLLSLCLPVHHHLSQIGSELKNCWAVFLVRIGSIYFFF